MILSFGIAGLAHAASATTRFASTCVFQVVVHLSRNPPQTPEHQQFIATLGLQQVGTAIASGIYPEVARTQEVDPASFQNNVFTRASPGLGSFVVTVSDTNGHKAIALANAVCDEFIARIKAQRSREVASQVKNVEDRIATIQAEVKKLEAIPEARRTAIQVASLQGQRGALQFNTAVIANLISLPPDEISVLSKATVAARRQTGSLSRNLIIALVGGLLACFLYILVGEVIVEARRTRGGSTPVGS